MVAGGDDAEVGHERREGILGDLGPRGRDGGDQRRLARAREADERDVGDALELEDDVLGLARLAEQRETGSPAAGRRQRRVAEAARAARGQHVAGAGAHQVGELLAGLGVDDDGAVGNVQHQVRALGAGAVAALARLAGGGALVGVEVEVEQRGDGGIDDEDHVAAAATVAAVGTAERDELLAVHAGAAVTAVARS